MISEFLETVKSLDGVVYNLKYHQSRYESVLKSFNILEYKNLKDYINPPMHGLYRCRLVYDKSKIDVEYIKYKMRNIKTLKLVYDDDIEYDKKSTSRQDLNKLFEQKDSCDDILIVKNSLLTDTSIANVALFDGKRWFTPKNPLLEGTTRKRLLDEGKIYELEIGVDDICNFEKIALLNAMIDFDIIAGDSLKDIIC